MATDVKDRQKAIDLAIAQIDKQFGRGAIMKMGDAPIQAIEVIPTGSLALDWALGVGGVPRGRVIEIFGPESSGKTTLALHIVAEAQKLGGAAAFIDAEHAIDVVYSAKLGVDIDNLLVSQPDTGEQALDIVEMLIRSNALDVIVIDSVAALVPKAEIDGEMGDTQVGLQARLMSKALRKLTGILSKSSTCAIFINQIREKVGVIFGNPETTSGGRALKFYASVPGYPPHGQPQERRNDRQPGEGQGGEEQVAPRSGSGVRPDLRRAFRKPARIVGPGVEHNIVDKSGAWYMYNDQKLGQGRENAKASLKDNRAVR